MMISRPAQLCAIPAQAWHYHPVALPLSAAICETRSPEMFPCTPDFAESRIIVVFFVEDLPFPFPAFLPILSISIGGLRNTEDALSR